MDSKAATTDRVPLPVTDPPGTSPLLTQPIEFEPLTSTLLVQQIQSQLNPDPIENEKETDELEKSDRTEIEEENFAITQEKQDEKVDESKIDENPDTADVLKFSSRSFVEPCETSSSSNNNNTQNSQYKNLNNNNDDEYINKNIKVAEKEGGKSNDDDDNERKDILEYLVTFSDSAEQKELLRQQKESEVSEKPPIPLPTYLWEDLKKAKEQGAYPWTHLYKRKFDPDDPVVFSTFPKKTSPKTPKKVRIQEETLNTGSVPNLFENLEKLETTFEKEEAQKVSSEEPSASGTDHVAPSSSPKSILKRAHDPPATEDSKAVAAGSSKAPKLKERLKSFNENIKSFSGKQMEKLEKAKRHIKKIPLSGKELVLQEKQKILRLKQSPKTGKHEFVSYLEKQDSDDTVEIVVLDDSPSNSRKNEHSNEDNGVPVPDEIIELNQEVPETTEESPKPMKDTIDDDVELNFAEQTVPQIIEPPATEKKIPPPKAPRKQKGGPGHIYEDIEDPVKIDPLMLDFMSGGSKDMKESLKIQDQLIFKELKQKSEEEEDTLNALTSEVKPHSLLAPISSIDSTSSDEDRERRNTLPALVEESDTGMSDVESEVTKPKIEAVIAEEKEKPEEIPVEMETTPVEEPQVVPVVEETKEVVEEKPEETQEKPEEETKDTIKEDVTIEPASESLPVPTEEKVTSRWSAMSDHEYEPIGQPEEQKASGKTEAPPSPDVQMSAQEFQLHLEDRFFNQAPPPTKPEVVITAPSFDEAGKSGLQEPEKRKKSFMASAQEQGRIFQRKLSSQADSLKTKFSNINKKKPSEGETVEEVVKEEIEVVEHTEHTPKKRFQKPDFTKLKVHLPEFKRPEMPQLKKPNFEKIKAMKRPSFDRPRMPEIPKMDFNKHIQNMKKLGRSKSVKEETTEEPETSEQVVVTETHEEEIVTTDTVPTKKKRFEVDFRTYPRMITNKFKKTKKPTPIASVKNITPVLKPRSKGAHSKQELDTESGQFTEYNKDIDLDRETSVERRMRVHLEKAIEEYRQIEEEETKANQLTKQESLPRKKKGKKAIPQPDSFDSREFDFNQNEMDSEGASKASTQELQDIIKRSQIRPFGRTDTQSLQSGDRRGVLEEIDDDQFFLRKKGISEDNIQMGEYISSAIREGLMDPVNVLAQMGQYDDYQLDEEEMRYLEEIQKQGSDFQLELDSNLMPSKPGRRHQNKKQSSEEISDEQANKWTPIKDIDEDSVEISHRDFSRFVPPTPPKRRKKRNAPIPQRNVKSLNGYEELPDVPSHQQEVIVYRQEQTFTIPLAKAESGDSFVPVPTARRSRSRSQSVLKDENRPINIIEEDKLSLEIPGYAVIKKDPPPRPPAPQPRRSKSTRSHERPFNTMPHLKGDEMKPERPARNYSTIIPDRPPRKPVSEVEKSGTPYEEVSDSNNDEIVRKLQSGEVLSKMKDRPLPAPPRPTREKKRQKSEEPFKGEHDTDKTSQDNDNQDDNNDDKGGSAVRAILETADSFTSNEYKIEEVDVSCQTDPLPDDFQLEELEITDDMRTITPTMYRETGHHVESHVMERFSRPETPSIEQELQRIREGRPSSRHSMNASSRTPSRPTTPALVYVERKISTPLLNNEEMIEASLTAHQVEIDFDEETGNVIVTGLVSEPPSHVSRLEEQTQKEDDVLKSIEDEIIPTILPTVETRKEEEPQVQVQHETKVEQVPRVDPIPVEEPIFEAVRAPIRPEPIIQLPEPVVQEQTPLPPPPPQITQQTEPVVTPIIPQPQQPTLQQLAPDQPLHLSNLSVDRLSVNELQASKISVSELDSTSINSREIQCQSGNLSMRSIEIPPGVIEEIVERVSRVQREQQADRQSPVSIPPPSFYQLTSESPQQTEAEPVAPPRRTRQTQQQTEDNQQQGQSEPPTILSLSGQLANACGSELSRHGSNLMTYLKSFSKDENRRDMHFVLFVLIIIIAGLFMIGMDHSDRTVHHHHWDFFNPPKNGEQK